MLNCYLFRQEEEIKQKEEEAELAKKQAEQAKVLYLFTAQSHGTDNAFIVITIII